MYVYICIYIYIYIYIYMYLFIYTHIFFSDGQATPTPRSKKKKRLEPILVSIWCGQLLHIKFTPALARPVNNVWMLPLGRLTRVWKHASMFCCEWLHILPNTVGHVGKALVANLATHGMQLTCNCSCQKNQTQRITLACHACKLSWSGVMALQTVRYTFALYL